MQSNGIPFRFLALPQEARGLVYQFYLPDDYPLPSECIDDPPPAHLRSLWSTCKLIRNEARIYQSRDAFIMANTFEFWTLQKMKQFLMRAFGHTRGLIRSLRLAKIEKTDLQGFLMHGRDFDRASLLWLLSFPNLRELTVDTKALEGVTRAKGSTWMQTPEHVRDGCYTALVQEVINALPLLPRGLILRIQANTPDHELGIHQRSTDMRMKNKVRIAIMCRSRREAGWLGESVEEEAPPDLSLAQLAGLSIDGFSSLCRRVVRQ